MLAEQNLDQEITQVAEQKLQGKNVNKDQLQIVTSLTRHLFPTIIQVLDAQF